MTMLQVAPPYPVFADLDGSPLDAGYIYIGMVNLNPETDPIPVFWDENLSISAAQPIRTIGGVPSRNGSPGTLYADGTYSITVKDKQGGVVYSSPIGYSVTPGTVAASTQVVTVANNIGVVNSVAGSMGHVLTVEPHLGSIDAVAGDLAGVWGLDGGYDFGSITDPPVGAISPPTGNIVTVAENIDSVNRVAENIDAVIDFPNVGITFGSYGPTSITYGSGGNIVVSSGNPASGPGGSVYDGGILTHSVSGNYQVSAYQVAATTGTLPTWGPVSEFVSRATADQATNFARISFTSMAAYAGPALNDAADDFRIQQEAGGSVGIKPIKITSQYNTSGWYLEYIDCLPGGNLQLFRRTDSPAPTGNNLSLILGQDKRATADVLTSAGQQDSPYLHIYGNAYDTALHTSNWRQYVDVTSNSGSSTYRIQSQIDSAGWSDRLRIDDSGGLGALTSITLPTLTPTNGTVTVSSLSAHAGGTFTPSLQFGGATTGITYSAQIGRFQRTGNRVYFEVRMALSSKGSATGTATIGGLPFTTLNLSGMVWSASFAGNNYDVGVLNLIATISAGATTVSLQKFATGSISNMVDTDFNNNSTLTITGTYEV